MPAHSMHASVADLMEQMEITPGEIAWRKAFLEFAAADIAALEAVNGLAEHYADTVIDDFYQHLLSFPEARAFFQDPRMLESVKQRQREYFLALTRGDYGTHYFEERLAIGAVHERIGLPMKLYLGMYSFYLRAVATHLFEALKDEPERARETFLSLMKLTFLDMGLAIDTYIQQREQVIKEQQAAIRELSTPVLQVRERLLILPIVGVIDARRAQQLTQQLLRAIRANRAKVVVIDVTGVPVLDTVEANHLVQTVEASRLMGATVIITGLSGGDCPDTGDPWSGHEHNAHHG